MTTTTTSDQTGAAGQTRLFDGLSLPASADFHVHLRDGEMMAAVASTIARGGVDVVFVMVSFDVLFCFFLLLLFALQGFPGKL